MFYVRHNSQARFATKQEAWAYAKRLRCDLDIYDSSEHRVVFGTYSTLIHFWLVDAKGEEDGVGDAFEYQKTLKASRNFYAAVRREGRIADALVSHWNWDTNDWETVYDSLKKA